MRIVDAVVLAAGTPTPDEALYPLTQGRRKALLPIAGKPMITWVLDALERTHEIRNLIIVGATADELGATAEKPRRFVADHGDMLANMFAGATAARTADPPATHVLIVSSDIPAVTSAAIDWHVAATRDSRHEAHAFLIAREVMERRFPGSGRTFIRLREGRFTMGDMSLFALTSFREHHPVWPRLIAARKRFLAQARLVGLDSVVLLLLGRLTIAGCTSRVRTRLGLDAEVVVCPHAEAAMDVDKPAHYTLLAADLARPTKRPGA